MAADHWVGQVHVLDLGLELAAITLGDLVAEDDGELVRLADSAIGVEKPLAELVEGGATMEREIVAELGLGEEQPVAATGLIALLRGEERREAGKPLLAATDEVARGQFVDAATGLALLTGDFGAAKAPPLGALAPDLVVLSAGGERVSAIPAARAGGAEPAVVAALGKSAAGSPVFDRQGGLAGVVAPIAEEPKRVGGVALAGRHGLIDAEAIGAFLGGGTLTPIANPAPLSTGAIAAREKTAVAAVTCAK